MKRPSPPKKPKAAGHYKAKSLTQVDAVAATSHETGALLGKPDADHCINQFIHHVQGGNDEQTKMMRALLHRVMVDGLTAEEAWQLLEVDPALGRRLWLSGQKQFTTHFNRFINRLLEFQKALNTNGSQD